MADIIMIMYMQKLLFYKSNIEDKGQRQRWEKNICTIWLQIFLSI